MRGSISCLFWEEVQIPKHPKLTQSALRLFTRVGVRAEAQPQASHTFPPE